MTTCTMPQTDYPPTAAAPSREHQPGPRGLVVSELRAHLSDYLDRAREGDEIVITDRGMPIARLLGLTATAILDRLAADGVIARAAAPRPTAAGRARPRPLRPVADRVSDQRR